MSLHLQVKLLRFLQERVLGRVGGRRTIEVAVRVVSATNEDLAEAMVSGNFREDLYYRLSEFSVTIPPLRDRGDDVVIIAKQLLRDYSVELRRPAKTFSDDALSAIAAYPGPGNVRELQNRIKRAVIMAKGRKATAGDLELAVSQVKPKHESLQEARDRAERQSVENALALSGGNISTAAKILRISRPKLYDLLRRHNVRP